MSTKSRHWLKVSYKSIIAIAGIGLFVFGHHSSPAIASYSNYVSPDLKITRQYDSRYHNRFLPKPASYLSIKHLHIKQKLTVKRPDPKYRALIRHRVSLVRTEQHLNALSKQQRISSHQHRKQRKQSYLQKLKSHFKQRHLIKQQDKTRHQLQMVAKKQQRTPALINQTKHITRQRTIIRPLPYHIRKIAYHKIMYLRANYPVWKTPYQPGVPWTTATNRLAHAQQAVLIRGIAKSKRHTFYRIESCGHLYGWVTRPALVKAHVYQLPFHYYSQMRPLRAPDACEAVSLRMALSTKGKDPNISMRSFIDRIPRNKNPDKGYTASPYRYGDQASIYPKALAKYGRRYDRHVHAFTGITKHRLIKELEAGNPVVFEGSYRMHDTTSDHTLVLIGYSDDSLKFADPYYKKDEVKPISWVSIRQFTKLFHQSLRGSRAVVVK